MATGSTRATSASATSTPHSTTCSWARRVGGVAWLEPGPLAVVVRRFSDVAHDDTEVVPRNYPARLDSPGLDLLVVDGADRGAHVAVRGTVRVGTADGNDLRLTDPTVSRVHATLSLDAGQLRIKDMGSTNGTFVDGVRVRDANVAAGSLLRLGSTTLRAELASEPVQVEL